MLLETREKGRDGEEEKIKKKRFALSVIKKKKCGEGSIQQNNHRVEVNMEQMKQCSSHPAVSFWGRWVTWNFSSLPSLFHAHLPLFFDLDAPSLIFGAFSRTCIYHALCLFYVPSTAVCLWGSRLIQTRIADAHLLPDSSQTTVDLCTSWPAIKTKHAAAATVNPPNTPV